MAGFTAYPSPLEESRPLDDLDQVVYVKRDDLIHSHYGGNKWRKLQYNLAHMQSEGLSEIVTLGGPFSNHVYAVAGAARDFGLQATIYVRGEIDDPDNPVLSFARECNANLVAMKRKTFALRGTRAFRRKLMKAHPQGHFVPEGGTNAHAMPGCQEIVKEVIEELGVAPEVWIVPGGTGGTAVGIASALPASSRVVVVSAVRKEFLAPSLERALTYLDQPLVSTLTIDDRFHFGGLAKWDAELLTCIQRVENERGLQLDPIYNGKAWFAMEQLIRSGEIRGNESILFLHTGGTAGRMAFEYRFGGQTGG